MPRNNHVVLLTALDVALLLHVVLLPGAGIVAQPVRERLPVRELTYVVEPIIQGESCRLLVGLTFQGDSSGESRLLLPLEWSHGVELYRAIRNIRSLSEDVKVEDTKEPHVKTVHHRPNQRVSLTYEVVSQPPGTKLTIAVYHYPVLRSSYFYVIGQALWVYPDMPETTPLRVTLHWKNIPNGWALINSFGASEPRQKVKTTLEKFRKVTIVEGATQKVLQYYPASTEAIRLPQFRLKEGLSVEERAQCLSQLGVSSAPRKLHREDKKP